MATWSIKYPLNISPLGTNRQEGFEKHVLEFTEVYNYLNLVRKAQAGTVTPTSPETNDLWLDTSGTTPILKYWSGSVWVTLMPPVIKTQSRCSVVSGDNDNPILEGSGSSTAVTLKASASKPVIFSFTDGFSLVTGDNDYIGYINADTVLTGIPTSATSYIYANRDTSTGGITLGYSALPLLVQDATPSSTATGQHWYTPIHGKMYVYASGWVTTQRVFIGEAITSTASVVSVSVYAYNSVGNKYPYLPHLPLDTDGTLAANSDSKIATQKAVKAYVDANAGGGGASIGTGNYIAEPFDVVPGTGLAVSVAANRCVIDETSVISTAATTVALTAKAAQLIYKKKDNTYDKLLPKMTAADLVDANTVGLWFPDGSASVPNAAVGVNGNTLAVANNLTKTGTITAVDGWAGGDAAKGDGSTGYYTSANSTGFPTGSNPLIELSVGFSYGGVTATRQTVLSVGGNTTQYFSLEITAGGNLQILYGGTFVDIGFALDVGRMYQATLQYNGSEINLSVDGQSVYRLSSPLIIYPATMRVLCFDYSGPTLFSKATIHFVEIRNALRTPAQIATLAQKLLIPCAYGTTDIRNALSNPTEAQIVAFVRTSATVPTTIIDASDPKGATSDWAYGMRIGPMGLLNRRKFLGWKYFSGAAGANWDNPFDSRKLRTLYVWAQDSAGMYETSIINDVNYGIPDYWASPSIRISCYTGSGAVYFKGAYQTSGYLGCYAEVID